MTMLRHTAGLRQTYDKMRFTKKIVWESDDKSYNKMYDTSFISCRM